MNKAELRREMLLLSEALSESERKKSDSDISTRFLEGYSKHSFKKVFVYVGVGHEIATDRIIENLSAQGKEIYVPLCHGKGQMDAVRIFSLSELTPGRYGIPEPKSGGRALPPHELNLIIVPGVAFGEDCTRLGRGGGYYDRFMAEAKNALKIALCREINIQRTVPCELHDETVDGIVTELRIIKRKER